MRILIVDDHEIVREGLRLALARHEGYDIVGAVHDGRAALTRARQTLPDVAIVDLRLPDMSGDELCRRLRRDFPSTAVVILTAYLSEDSVRVCFHAGAAAYVTKAAGLPELRAALERVPEERRSASTTTPQIVARLHALVAQREQGATATPQQARVLELAARGLTDAAIGKRMFISESTVRFHLQKMKAKLDARNKTELIAKAMRSGIISAAEDADGLVEARPPVALVAQSA